MFTKKYRNMDLESMVGSVNARATLSKLMETKSLPSSIIISGENGLGKTTISYILALNTICGCKTCEVCREIIEQLWEYKPKALTGVYEFDLGKDNSESDIDNLMSVFMQAGKKVIIVDEIQNIDQRYMDKFLKTLEKCDENTLIIFTTTAFNKINFGIVSRSECFELTPPTTGELATHLEAICINEGVQFDRPGLYALAKIKYRVRDALISLETIINAHGKVTLEIVRQYFGKSDYEDVLKFLISTKKSSPYEMLLILQDMKDKVGLFKFSESLKEVLINSIYCRYNIKPLFIDDDDMMVLKDTIMLYSSEELSHMLDVVSRLQYKSNLDKEVALINLAFMLSNGSILKRMNQSEEYKAINEKKNSTLDEDIDLTSLEHKPISGFTLDKKAELSSDENKRETQKGTVMDLGIPNQSQFLKALFGGEDND